MNSEIELGMGRHETTKPVAGRLAGAFSALLLLATPAFALSEIQREELPPAEAPSPEAPDGRALPPATGLPVPLPDPASPPVETPAEAVPPEGEPVEEEEATEPAGEAPETTAQGPIPEVLYDLARLPEPVRRMRELLVEACVSGDIEKLRPLIASGEDGTQLSLGGVEGDVIAFLKQVSGDGEGHEMLAILLEVLNAGFVHLDAGEPGELYVWPYFFAVPLDRLTAPQRVELFKIVTAGDYEEMKTYGAYIFYRVGITPDGRWAFFVAGD